MQGDWLRKSKEGACIVFVHGFLSDGRACWRHANGTYWPELLTNELSLGSTGVYVYSYQTDIFSGTYRLGDIVDDLKERSRLDGVFSNKKIVFVCHSMGGIVVRRFLVERYLDFIDRKIEVGLFLIASPSLGSGYANLLSVFAKVVGNTQAQALRFGQNNPWLSDLDKEFQNLKENRKLRIYGKELIEDKFVVLKRLWLKQVVEPFSGARYFGDPYKVPQSDHFSIAKPVDREAIQHRLLCQYVREFLNIDATCEVETHGITNRMAKTLPDEQLEATRESHGHQTRFLATVIIVLLLATGIIYFRWWWTNPCNTDQATLGCP